MGIRLPEKQTSLGFMPESYGEQLSLFSDWQNSRLYGQGGFRAALVRLAEKHRRELFIYTQEQTSRQLEMLFNPNKQLEFNLDN